MSEREKTEQRKITFKDSPAEIPTVASDTTAANNTSLEAYIDFQCPGDAIVELERRGVVGIEKENVLGALEEYHENLYEQARKKLEKYRDEKIYPIFKQMNAAEMEWRELHANDRRDQNKRNRNFFLQRVENLQKTVEDLKRMISDRQGFWKALLRLVRDDRLMRMEGDLVRAERDLASARDNLAKIDSLESDTEMGLKIEAAKLKMVRMRKELSDLHTEDIRDIEEILLRSDYYLHGVNRNVADIVDGYWYSKVEIKY